LGIQEHVRLSGYVADSDLPALYSQCQAFVFPTLYEGFGMPALEAMACGVPVIGSTAAALPEIIGEAGLLVDPLDVEAIGAAIHRAVSDRDLRSRLAEAGPRRASLFSWERAARETVAAYGEVIRG